MTKYKLTVCSLAILLTSGSLARADQTVRGQQVSVRLQPNRARQLKSMATRLNRIGVPGYATLYRTSQQIVGLPKTDGAMVFATVNGSKVKAWHDSIGKNSVGLATRCMPDKGVLGACIRLGNDWYHYETVRGREGFKPETVTDKFSDRGKTADQVKSGVEATFMVNPSEMSALRAFVVARHLLLVNHTANTTGKADEVGKPINPVWKKMGASGNFNNESCAQACTSFLNNKWLGAFAENLPRIQAYGRQHGISELAGASQRTISTLKAFQQRTGLNLMVGYKEIVKNSSPKADAVTVFNMIPSAKRVPGAVQYLSDPLNNLRWSVPGWANGLQHKTTPRCTTLLDRAPGQGPLRQSQIERVSLSSFAGNL